MIKEATFGAGCFWCIEACLKDVKGVLDVYPGYAGGDEHRTTYQEVCSGTTGHAEVVRVEFDDQEVAYVQLLEMFWFVHDPTQLNRQGNDIGTQYRSVIFYHDEEQKNVSYRYKDELTKAHVWEQPIVTEISPLTNFFHAEENHRNYFENNPQNGYCQFVVRPKVIKFREVFAKALSDI